MLVLQTVRLKWLGFDWGNNIAHASDYFESIHESALELSLASVLWLFVNYLGKIDQR